MWHSTGNCIASVWPGANFTSSPMMIGCCGFRIRFVLCRSDQLESEARRVAHPIVAHIGVPLAQGRPNRRLGESGSENMCADVLKRSVVRVEIKPGQDVARLMAFRHGTDRGPKSRRELAHLIVTVDVGSDQYSFGVDHFHHQDLIMMAIVSSDAREARLFVSASHFAR